MITLHRLAEWVAAGGGSGWLPRAPGTWGSLAALLPGWWLWHLGGVTLLLLAVVALTLLGCWVSMLLLPELVDQDPGWIVVDEWVGVWLTMVVVAVEFTLTWQWVVASFALFRVYDIFKPWPINLLEHSGPVWWSIMADDLAAGVLAGASLLACAGFLQSIS
ncbi:MAG: phosphatidylglycerophosphatase A [Mariprofundales bacterium]|nr:phosphatidylglycerophosphatase A [Mariprofundales bacterium]